MADFGESSARQIYGLPAGQVFLEHADVPLVNQAANARTCLAIVSDAVRKMSKSDDHPLSVSFLVNLGSNRMAASIPAESGLAGSLGR
jgi:hypothetical protein